MLVNFYLEANLKEPPRTWTYDINMIPNRGDVVVLSTGRDGNHIHYTDYLVTDVQHTLYNDVDNEKFGYKMPNHNINISLVRLSDYSSDD